MKILRRLRNYSSSLTCYARGPLLYVWRVRIVVGAVYQPQRPAECTKPGVHLDIVEKYHVPLHT